MKSGKHDVQLRRVLGRQIDLPFRAEDVRLYAQQHPEPIFLRDGVDVAPHLVKARRLDADQRMPLAVVGDRERFEPETHRRDDVVLDRPGAVRVFCV